MLHTVLHLQTNTFQSVMATNSSSSFVIYLYADLQWAFADPRNMGSASGNGSGEGFNTPMDLDLEFGIAGFIGPEQESSLLPGSNSNATLELNSTSNVGRPGLWIFQVDGEEVVSGGMTAPNLCIAYNTKYTYY